MVFDFFRQFVLNPIKTGAIAPSSDELAELITDEAELRGASVVMELGTGTGVFTEKIVGKLNKNAEFFAFEINPEFVKKTKERCLNVKVHNDSVVNAKKYLKGKKCDRIISGLPWAGFNDALQNKLLDSVYNSLKPNGKFLTFAYVHGTLLPAGNRFKEKLNQKFSKVEKTKIVWKNMPPAFVYVAKK